MIVRALPAGNGDCLWVEWGDRKLLVDAGTPESFEALRAAIEELPARARHFELLVVSHVDRDHIGGVLPLLAARKALGITFGDVWFNGYAHVADTSDLLGPVDGEALSEELAEGKPKLRWNRAFRGKAVAVPASGPLPRVELEGKLQVTVLSPTAKQLDKLEPRWKKAVEDAGLVPGAFAPPEEDDDLLGHETGPIDVEELVARRTSADGSATNGSSIALLLEHEGARCLLAADALAPVLVKSLRRLDAQPIPLGLFKLSHHGSKANLSAALLDRVACREFLVSTDGSTHGHPDREALARIVARGGDPRLHFNFRTDFTRPWADRELRARWGYRTRFGAGGIVEVEL
jgi:metal-dependent hydrolase (beta-lactamase superfamily II)